MAPELLAPAKNLDIALAAVNHGADAVYMGAPKFGAREAAGNSLAEVEKAVRYAHRYRAKLFLTLNTLLFDHELDEARKIAVAAYNMGCDALIVQDMAFLQMDLPPIPLHASTQAHNATPQKVKFLQEVGFQRVVLARELSLKQVEEIRSSTTVELESFIHGALCVSYSGQCYLSHLLTGRSANRGACAQPCRSAYDLVDGQGKTLFKGKHLLSLKDLNLTQHLQQLAAAGVCSFKIEGRLKDVDYVKNVVAHYRKTLDRVFAGQKRPSSGRVELGFEPNPEKTFSRGFCSYFLENEKAKNIASLNTPKSLGEKIGKIKAVDHQSIFVDLQSNVTPPCAGDGLCFFDSSGTLHGAGVNRVEGKRLWLQNMESLLCHCGLDPQSPNQRIPAQGRHDSRNKNGLAGCSVFRNFDYAFQKQLANPNSARRLIDVDITFEATEKNVQLTATDEDGISVMLTVEKEPVEAKNEERALATLREQLGKSGGLMFNIKSIDLRSKKSNFYTISELNAWRRKLLEMLEEKRTSSYVADNKNIIKNKVAFPYLHKDFKLNIVNNLSKVFYENHGVAQPAWGYELQKPAAGAALMTTRYCVLRELGCCKKEKNAKHLREPLYLENNGQRLRLSFDCKACEMKILEDNNQAATP